MCKPLKKVSRIERCSPKTDIWPINASDLFEFLKSPWGAPTNKDLSSMKHASTVGFPNLIWICSHVKNVSKVDLHFRHQSISIDNPEIVFYSWLVQGTVILDSRENDRTCAGWKCTKNIICKNLKPSSSPGKKIITISFVHCQYFVFKRCSWFWMQWQLKVCT